MRRRGEEKLGFCLFRKAGLQGAQEKKAFLGLILVFFTFLFGFALRGEAATLLEIYDELKQEQKYQTVLSKLEKEGATESQVRALVADISAYLVQEKLTAENFEGKMLEALIKVYLDSQHKNVFEACARAYPEVPGVLMALAGGQPWEEAIKRLPNDLKACFEDLPVVKSRLLAPPGAAPGGGPGQVPGSPPVKDGLFSWFAFLWGEKAKEVNFTAHPWGKLFKLPEKGSVLEVGKAELTARATKEGKEIKIELLEPEKEGFLKAFVLPPRWQEIVAEKSLALSLGPVAVKIPAAGGKEVASEKRLALTGKVVSAEGSSSPGQSVPGLTLRGAIYELTFVLLPAADEISSSGEVGKKNFEELKTFPGGFTLAFSLAALPSRVEKEKLGIYRLEEESWTYVGGWVNREANTLEGALNSLGKYAVFEAEKSFPDLSTHWARKEVEAMAARQVAQGTPEGKFLPGAKVTRAEFCAFLVRTLETLGPAVFLLEETEKTLPFSDVTPEKWYYPAVARAYQLGLVKGVSEVSFAPEAEITRESLAVMASRARGEAEKRGAKFFPGWGEKAELSPAEVEKELSRFADRGKISTWAQEGVAFAARQGIVAGRTPYTFVPQAPATRAESLVMLFRLLSF